MILSGERTRNEEEKTCRTKLIILPGYLHPLAIDPTLTRVFPVKCGLNRHRSGRHPARTSLTGWTEETFRDTGTVEIHTHVWGKSVWKKILLLKKADRAKKEPNHRLRVCPVRTKKTFNIVYPSGNMYPRELFPCPPPVSKWPNARPYHTHHQTHRAAVRLLHL